MASKGSLNFQGVDPMDILTEKNAEIINSISPPEVNTFKQKLFAKKILSLKEFRSCATADILCDLLFYKTQEQVEFFLNDLCSTAGKQGIRSEIEKLIIEKKAEQQESQESGKVAMTDAQPISQLPIPSGTIQLLQQNRAGGQQLPSLEHFPGRRGIKFALIINVHEDRAGAEFDDKALKETLAACKFDITICEDLSTDGILKILEDFKFKLEQNKGNIAGCLVAVMSHGTGNEWFKTFKGHELNLYKDIVDKFKRQNCPVLNNVPKVFLVNVCRGDDVDGPKTDFSPAGGNSQPISPKWLEHFDNLKSAEPCTDNASSQSGPSWKDMLICYASYFNCVAYRETTGTWYIQTFCKIVKRLTYEQGPTETDIETIIKWVNDEINNKSTVNGAWQTPCFKNVGYLKNRLYLKWEP